MYRSLSELSPTTGEPTKHSEHAPLMNGSEPQIRGTVNAPCVNQEDLVQAEEGL